MAAPSADSQKTSGSPAVTRFRRVRIGIWYGRSAYPAHLLGKIQQNRIRMIGIRFRRVLIPTRKQTRRSYTGPIVSYTADIIPFASAHIPWRAIPYFEGMRIQDLSTNGFGLYPIGLEFSTSLTDSVQPFVSGHAGMLYFSESVPDRRGKQLNFAVGIGGGLQVALPGRLSIRTEYRYHHLSNGFRGSINPGLDANVFYFGCSVGL